MKNVVVAGASGLVGSSVVRLLEKRDDVTVWALARRPGSTPGSRRREVLFDPRADGDVAKLGGEIPCDVLLSCLGTTIRKAGSQAAFRAVDHELPVRLLERLKKLEVRPGFGLVSSVGADRPSGFYLKTKRETEEAVQASGLPYVIVRPSVLDGERGESRPLERLALGLMRPLCGAAAALTGRGWGALGRLQPIPADTVARALVRNAVDRTAANVILEGWDLYDPA